jgi:hypothetical protein
MYRKTYLISLKGLSQETVWAFLGQAIKTEAKMKAPAGCGGFFKGFSDLVLR